MKRAVSVITLLMFFGLLMAQQDPQFSHYYNAVNFFNPAQAAMDKDINLGLVSRQQWVKFEGAPQSTVMYADMPFSFSGNDFGAGIVMLDDRYAFIRDFQMKISGAYKYALSYGILSFGLNVGIFSKEFDPDWKFPDQTENLFNKGNSLTFDADIGLLYRYRGFVSGISVTHFLKPNINVHEVNSTYEIVLNRQFYLYSKYTFSPSGSLFDITPSILVKSSGVVTQFDINLNILYNKKFWTGVSYRNGESVDLFVGTSYFNDVKLGFSYDFLVNSINRVSSGSMEVYVGYNFSLLKMSKPKFYHNVKTL